MSKKNQIRVNKKKKTDAGLSKSRPKSKTGFRPHKKKTDETAPAKSDGLIRLNKFLANSGVCSRREADVLIESGAVSVNGEIVTRLGTKVKPSDTVFYNGQKLRAEKKVYVLLNKPKDFITTTDDPQKRKTVLDLVRKAGRERIFPVGRLDRNTTGLLLLTNDGELAKKLTHPSHGVKKLYEAHLDKPLTKADMVAISEGVVLDGEKVIPDAIAYAGTGEKKEKVGVELHSGQNRVVKRIFEHFGYKVVKLDRSVFAGLTKKDLPRGKWRFLTEKEVGYLMMGKQ